MDLSVFAQAQKSENLNVKIKILGFFEFLLNSANVKSPKNGTLKIDENSGWVLSSKMNIKTTNKQTMTDGKRTETMTAVSESTVSVN